ncbi:hypothetical protein LEP48_17235 [Isoptericola sp. NEAU-Y5]|uniref:Uncharacterized protein n=1 Tax=Isoptericola luteus TaxID=2879484 RepID=A0ABS7ZJ76_9MICO|nr:hypothetical protein [Isoptericola sp. NEAU-Y5]MCA5895076.1 hypothetical protein [Isoptericola sp. NEAU-Y5]
MGDDQVTSPARPAGQGPRPGRVALRLRPVGYLLVGVVWTTIVLVALLLLVGSVPYLAYVDSDSLVRGVGERLSNPVEAVAFVLLALPVLALAVGAGGWHVLTASWPLAVLSFVYVGRALSPDYAGEKLSFTAHAPRGTTFGPPTLSGVAMSLQPVRSTPFTDAVMRFYVAGWVVDGRTVVAMLPAGLAWPLAITALVPGVPGVVNVVAGVLAVGLLATSVVLGTRAFRRRFEPEGPGAAAGGRALSDLSADELRARRARVERQRRARLRRGGTTRP